LALRKESFLLPTEDDNSGVNEFLRLKGSKEKGFFLCPCDFSDGFPFLGV